MKQILLKCKAITPMFSRGLVPEEGENFFSFELRPQSIKGVLRFWLRAIIPLVIDPKFYNYEEFEETKDQKKYWRSQEYAGMKKLEEIIMGSQHQKSSFSLQVNFPKSINPIGEYYRNKNNRLRLSYNQDFGTNKFNSRYAIYGTYDIKIPGSYDKYVYSFLPEGTEFEITLSILKKYYSQELEDLLIKLFGLVSMFSGFGAKTKKGFGEFEVINSKECTRVNPDENTINEAKEALKAFIEAKYSQYFKKSENYNDLSFPSFASYELIDLSALCPSLIDSSPKLVLSKLYQNYFDKDYNIKYLGWYPMLKWNLRMFPLEGKSKDLVSDLKEMIKGNKEQTKLTTGILGLPLQYQQIRIGTKYDKSVPITGKITFSPLVFGEQNNKGRKASPIHISIHKKIDSGKFYPVVLLLKSKISEGKLYWSSSTNRDREYEPKHGEAEVFNDFEILRKLIMQTCTDFCEKYKRGENGA
ncbi:hypothetical protein AT15_06345 [Kosmotoga arenicorallina S304]|uniref:CRISPR type III-associated protein domain-containing protein n=1 Tax=Kosmotoga arenicorallina S304 TaxID=1453497 RepID=A0A176JTP6_9BACT|nr:type III-B CRISPR module RAMP protein Cmr1 [Kosmotoga arenicorallina]OAA26692.1 hypothetical protein AT15_06345 [Kosmotoga arenicorallina S304]